MSMGSPGARRPYAGIVAHCEESLATHGSGAKAVNWKSERDAAIRYGVMLDLLADAPTCTLLDLGCGLGGLLDHIEAVGRSGIAYSGLDVSPRFVEAARLRHPGTTFLCLDILDEASGLAEHDFVVMNGVFTRRHDLSIEAMTDYMVRMLVAAWAKCRVGLAFNVMSAFVDWQDEALYYPDLGATASLVASRLSRHFTARNDYGLFETTFYVYRGPRSRGPGASFETV